MFDWVFKRKAAAKTKATIATMPTIMAKPVWTTRKHIFSDNDPISAFAKMPYIQESASYPPKPQVQEACKEIWLSAPKGQRMLAHQYLWERGYKLKSYMNP